jgi:NAD(P)-dependent dehydrogenase (short-subunit alcohol dehydrogenase family)
MSFVSGVSRAVDLVLDPSIAFSFDKTGFRRHRRLFDPEDLAVDMRGRICAITGANSGIGYATALDLAGRGAQVWLLCRNADRGQSARLKIIEATGNNDVHLEVVDVSDLGSVAAFVGRWEVESLDVLVHNAGVLLTQPGVSADGLELTLATNLVGPLALSAGLIARLSKGSKARMIWVSSGGMYTQKLCVESLERPSGKFDGVKTYARTKRAMVVFVAQLSERLEEGGVAVHCMHPGWADTPGVQNSIPGFWRLTQAILRTPEEGADTVVWLSVCDKAQASPGRLWFDRKPRSTHLLPGTRVDKSVRSEFWRSVHDWAGVSPDHWQGTSPGGHNEGA